MASNAVDTTRVSRIVGYQLTKGDFQNITPNLPHRIAILAEANDANQSGLSLTPTQVTSAQQAGQLYGYGSPIYLAMRILKPTTGGGVGSIPVVVYPQAKAGGAVAKVIRITPSGVATGNGTHTLVVAGREGMESIFYDINILSGDTTADITGKIEDALNNILGSPVIGTSNDYYATATSKWSGLTSNDLSITVDTSNGALGISYVITSPTAGSGTPSIAAALNLFGNEWNTIVINGYGAVSNIMSALETFNGIPDPVTPTGRYASTIMKPFIAFTGSTLEDPSSLTDSRLNNVTIAICSAPLSAGLPIEAAANYAVRYANQAQNSPQLDVAGQSLPDMPTPTSIGAMSDYDSRDTIVKKGCSTVDLVAGKYQIQDFVTTYHPIGENPAQFMYCRILNIDFNIKYGFYLLEQINVAGHAISDDNIVVSVDGVIKPKQWRQILGKYALDLSSRALIVDPEFMQDSITVNLSASNPDRLETFFKYKRSGFVRIASTTGEAGFNFGTLN